MGVLDRVAAKKDCAWLLQLPIGLKVDKNKRQAAEIRSGVKRKLVRKMGDLMRTRVLVSVAVVFCIGLWFKADVYAQLSGACADDLAKFCKEVQPGGGRLSKCLKEHQKELSPTCRDTVAAAQKRWNEAAESCHDDVLKFCKDVEPGGGRIANCLREHQSGLSADCREKWLKQKKK
jgi:hypothetical protein